MLRATFDIEKYSKKGEKTGWTYIEITAAQAKKIKAGQKKSFRVKGKLDAVSINGIALMPVGNGNFIMPLNAALRKQLGKKHGDAVTAQLQPDDEVYKLNQVFMQCLRDDNRAMIFFKTLAPSHQRYFSKWIDSAKTDTTKAKRIAMALNALASGWDYGTMIRNNSRL
jgi:hypothetical protein